MGKLIIVAIVSAVISITISVIKITGKRRKIKKELAMRAQDKLREEALDSVILNPNAPTSARSTTQATPFSVTYDSGNVERDSSSGKAEKSGGSKLMVQITENSELSAKKYMLDPSSVINIGRSETSNHIVIMDDAVDSVQCNIVEKDGRIYIRNAGASGKLILVRGTERAFVEKNPIELKNSDRIMIGKNIFKVDIVKLKV